MLVADDFVGAGALVWMAELAPHAPRDPEQEQAAREDEANNLEQLSDGESERDPEDQRSKHADHDHLAPLRGRKSGRERSHHDRIVASKHEVDQQDLEKGSKRTRLVEVREVAADRLPYLRRPTETVRLHGRNHDDRVEQVTLVFMCFVPGAGLRFPTRYQTASTFLKPSTCSPPIHPS